MVPVFAIWFVQAKRRRTSRGEGVSFRGILVLAVRGYAARRNVNIMPAPVGGSGDSLSRYQNSTILPAILRFSSIAFVQWWRQSALHVSCRFDQSICASRDQRKARDNQCEQR
jgi:hypothetical protein